TNLLKHTILVILSNRLYFFIRIVGFNRVFKGMLMTITVENLDVNQAANIIATEENQFGDVKGLLITPAQLSKTISALANTDGGDLYIGISENGAAKTREWNGFTDQEAANGHLQLFEKIFP